MRANRSFGLVFKSGRHGARSPVAVTVLPLALLLVSALQMALAAAPVTGAQQSGGASPAQTQTTKVQPMYSGAIPNSVPGPNEETEFGIPNGDLIVRSVSVPTLTVYSPAPSRSNRTAVIIFPGGAYRVLSYEKEGRRMAEALQDRGITAVLVKYRLPNDATMKDKSMAPLQDAQQAIIEVRKNAASLGIDPQRVGVLGFSAGGHLAATMTVHQDQVFVDNPDKVSLAPNFLVLMYPVISMANDLTHMDSRTSLLGKEPTAAQLDFFSADKHVSKAVPSTLIVTASDDTLVSVENSLAFYRAAKSAGVPVEMVLFNQGNHGFGTLSTGEWMGHVFRWMERGGYLRP